MLLQPVLDNNRRNEIKAKLKIIEDALTICAAVSINVQINDLAARKARDDADHRAFESLEKDGFLGEQNRLNAARILKRLHVRRRIASLEYQIETVDKVTILGQTENTGIVMSSSQISLNMRGFLDSDMHGFTATGI